MTTIDFNSESAYYYVNAVRALHKAGTRPDHWRPPVDAEEAETAWRVRAHVERAVYGYEAANMPTTLICSRCKMPIEGDNLVAEYVVYRPHATIVRAHHEECL